MRIILFMSFRDRPEPVASHVCPATAALYFQTQGLKIQKQKKWHPGILGVIAVLLGIGEFFYVLTITNLMKDPANAAAFNEFFEQFQRQLGIN